MKPVRSRKRDQALTLIETWVLIALIAVLVALYLPVLLRPRRGPSRINCVNNLKQVGLAFRLWALDNNDQYPASVSVTNRGAKELVASGTVFPHFQVMSNELTTPKLVICPVDQKRTAATNFDADFTDAKISYFVGVDADQNQPQMILSGDDNLAVRGIPAKPGLLALWTNSPVAWTANRHVNFGNILLADGSVQQVSAAKLREYFQRSGVVTNRLVMP